MLSQHGAARLVYPSSICPALARHARWLSLAATAVDSKVSGAAADASAPRVQQVQQGNQQEQLPHVSVLLKEVLHHLNHMPIKASPHVYCLWNAVSAQSTVLRSCLCCSLRSMC
jgi:hypothetical protein